MCCSIRSTVFFLASLHIYFAVSQLIGILPAALSSLNNKTMEALLALIFLFFFFSSGFMTFRGADEESSVLIGGGGIVLLVILSERFTLMYFDLLLQPSLPEGDFLGVYGSNVPIIFTLTLYVVYFVILFIYHKELRESSEVWNPSPSTLFPKYGETMKGYEDEDDGDENPRDFPGAPENPAIIHLSA